ncbi:recombinase family protein [Hymenobacter defluvii]|uniref:Recombinase family protein n=1 Tax=Hymenobacter defluvii TaxID=2054411 RepID=A0ABS3TF06_9BACT|nr:recombinase family protein [Hymenobacter defluvii]
MREWSIQKEYVEEESGGTGNRAEFRQLFEDAHRRRFDMVLFWSLDRFSREGAPIPE